MNTMQYCPQIIQYIWRNTLCQSNCTASIKLHLIDKVHCAILTLIVQGRGVEPFARGKISLAHDIHCRLNLLSYFFALSACLYSEGYACMYTYDRVQIAHELTLLPNNTAEKQFLHKSGAVRSVHWVHIIGCRPGGDWANT
jgi:hypothetical protein